MQQPMTVYVYSHFKSVSQRPEEKSTVANIHRSFGESKHEHVTFANGPRPTGLIRGHNGVTRLPMKIVMPKREDSSAEKHG